MRENKINNLILTFSLFLVFLTAPLLLNSQQEPEITLEKVAGRVYCVYGEGGNMGILKGENKLLVVDSQYSPNADEVLKELRKLSPNKIAYLINTHYHGDHTDGNPILGAEAKIISHQKCLDSFLAGLKPEESAEEKGAPQITFEEEMMLQVGEEKILLKHFGPGHTAGDTVVIFGNSGVIHAGDLFFNGMPPYIDVEDGANTKNWALTISKLAGKYPDFKVIPGHGETADMKAFMKFAGYLKYLRKKVQAAIKAGLSRKQAVESIDLSPFSYIKDSGEFLTKKKNIGWVYDEMTKKRSSWR